MMPRELLLAWLFAGVAIGGVVAALLTLLSTGWRL